MDDSNYWTRNLGRRVSRRAAIRGAGVAGLGLAGAALIGCGGDDDDGGGSGVAGGGAAAGGGGATAATSDAPTLTAAEFGDTSLEDLRRIYDPAYLRNLPGQVAALKDGPTYGGTYRYFRDAPAGNWDILGAGAFSLTIWPTHNSLLTFKFNGDWGPHGEIVVEPDLPKSWEIADDGLTHVFQLPDEPVYWQDFAPVNGRQFTSEDLAFGLNQLREAGVQSSTYRDVDSIEVVDSESVVVKFKRPAAYFAAENAVPIMWLTAPEHVEHESWGDWPIGTGPFQLKEAKRDIGITFDRNPRYWKKDPIYNTGKNLPYLDRLEGLDYPDRATYSAAWASHQTDYGSNANMSRREIQDLMELRPDAVMHISPPPPSWHPFIVMNTGTPPFNDARVRRALSMAVDRPGIIDGIVGGLAAPGYYLDWNFFERAENPWPWTFDELGPYMQYNPAEAKKMLQAAGFSDGLGRSIEIGWGTSTDGLNNAIYEAMADGLRTNLGIDLDQKLAVDGAAYNKKLYGVEYQDMHVATPRPAWDPQGFTYGALNSNSGGNYYTVNDPLLDELTEKQQITLDLEERREVVKQIMDRDLDQAYRLWGVMVYKFAIRDPKVFNLGDHYLAWMTPGWGERKVDTVWKQA